MDPTCLITIQAVVDLELVVEDSLADDHIGIEGHGMKSQVWLASSLIFLLHSTTLVGIDEHTLKWRWL